MKVWKHTTDYSGEGGGKELALYKSRLGDFYYYCHSNKIHIGDVYVMQSCYHGSYMQAAIEIEESLIDDFVSKTGIGLMDPPKVTLN